MASKDSKVEQDRDFIYSPKHSNSLKILMSYHPDGVPDAVICRVLRISKEELENLHRCAILKIRERIDKNDNKKE